MTKNALTLVLADPKTFHAEIDHLNDVSGDLVGCAAFDLVDQGVELRPFEHRTHHIAHLAPERRIVETPGLVGEHRIELAISDRLLAAQMSAAHRTLAEGCEVRTEAVKHATLDRQGTKSDFAIRDGDGRRRNANDGMTAISEPSAGLGELAADLLVDRLDVETLVGNLTGHDIEVH